MLNIETDHEGVRVSGYMGIEDQVVLEKFKNVLINQVDTITEKMVIDLTGIEYFDIAGLQLLLAVRHTLQTLNKTLVLKVGDELIDLLALTGLHWIFQTETSAPSKPGA